MLSFIKRILGIRKKKFVQDTAILQIASFFSTGLALVGSIIYARVLGVEGFAAYALIFVFVSLVSIFMNLGTNQTTLTILSEAYVKKDGQKVLDILTYYIKVTLLISVLVSVLVFILAPFLTSKLYSSLEIGQLARVVILANIVKVFYGMYVIVLQVTRKIKVLAVIENINKILYVVIPAGLVLLGYGLYGIVYGHLFIALSFVLFSWLAYGYLRTKDPIFPTWKEIFINFRKVDLSYYFKFGFLIAIDKNLGSLYHTLPILILGIFSLEQVAFLKIAIAYAGLPLVFMGRPIARLLTVQLPKSKSYSFKILKRDYTRSSFGSFLITFVAAIFFMALSPILIPLVYGPAYASAVFLTYPLLIATIIINLGVGGGPLFRTLHLMKASIIINSTFVVVGGMIVYYFARNYPIEVAVYPIAFWLPAVTTFQFLFLIRYLNKKIKEKI